MNLTYFNPNINYLNQYLTRGKNNSFEITIKYKLVTIVNNKRKYTDKNKDKNKDKNEGKNILNKNLVNKLMNNLINIYNFPSFDGAGGLNWSMNYSCMKQHIEYLLNTLIKNNYFVEGSKFDNKYKSIDNDKFINIETKKMYKISHDNDFTRVLGSLFIKKKSKNKKIINSPDYKLVLPDNKKITIDVVVDYFSNYNQDNILNKKTIPLFPVIKYIKDCIILEEYFESGIPIGYNTEFGMKNNKLNKLFEEYPWLTEEIGYIDFNDENILQVGSTYYLLNTKLDCFFQSNKTILYNEIFHRFNKRMEYNNFNDTFKNNLDNILKKKIKMDNNFKNSFEQSWRYYYKSIFLKYYNCNEILAGAINFVVSNKYYCKINESNRNHYQKKYLNYIKWKKYDFPNTYIQFKFNL
jgi:hypothetical protein